MYREGFLVQLYKETLLLYTLYIIITPGTLL